MAHLAARALRNLPAYGEPRASQPPEAGPAFPVRGRGIG